MQSTSGATTTIGRADARLRTTGVLPEAGKNRDEPDWRTS
jgi:hypothetical protein